ncbi:hypothetical protein LC607_35830, partial [Nostoc sp. CHAB 5824]|nr:hypothetical protein [Nostoc sp. CHAB 5824]
MQRYQSIGKNREEVKCESEYLCFALNASGRILFQFASAPRSNEKNTPRNVFCDVPYLARFLSQGGLRGGGHLEQCHRCPAGSRERTV